MFDIYNMMMMNYMSKIDLGKGIFTYEVLSFILLMTLFNFVKDKVVNNIPRSINYIISKIRPKHSNIEIVGWEYLNGGLYTFEYPQNMTAINYYIYSNKKSTNFKYFNSKRNGIYYSDDMKDAIESDSTPNYTLNDVYNIEVDTDIYVSVKTEDIKTDASPSDKTTSLNWKITMNIRSYKNDSNYIQEFINKCMLKYEQYTTSKSKNKTYHFIYQGKSQGKLVFSSKIISDFSNPDNQNYETFDNTFHSNKDMLMADIKRLRDIDFYKRTGLKRKKGYLFYGKPGTGKTLSVMNMSNYDKRHIIEVPMSRIKTNNEIEAILTLTHINNIKFNPNNIIILLDELDIGTKLNRKKETHSDSRCSSSDEKFDIKVPKRHEIEEPVLSEKDKLCFGTLLSRFDGIGNYGGLIIIGTTNNIDNIDPALYRDGRLNLVYFDYATYDDILNICKQYYQHQFITDKTKRRIKKLDKKLSHAKIRCKLEHSNNIDSLITLLETSLKETSLMETSLKETSLMETNLMKTNLMKTNLMKTNLMKTNPKTGSITDSSKDEGDDEVDEDDDEVEEDNEDEGDDENENIFQLFSNR
jgi:hypothetical protein